MENLCFNCMSKILENETVCPNCGKNPNEPQNPPFLPKKTLLGGRYIVGQGLEIDSEALSYIAYDKIKKSKIYLKEFFPGTFCERSLDFANVKEKENSKKAYKELLNEFLKYYRNVAKLRNLPPITAVYDIFTENNTAYIVFEWIEGIRLDKYLSQKNGYLSWEKTKILFMPLFTVLSHMHTAKVLHLGICPENIFVTDEEKLKITGFATKNLRNTNSYISYRLFTGCSALEQYIETYQPDESTDVYGLAATIFLCLTGEYPPSATSRKEKDTLLMPQTILEHLPDNVVTALANALRVYPNNRTLSFEAFGSQLSNSPIEQIKKENKNFKVNIPEKKQKKKNSNLIFGIISGIIAIIILIAIIGIYWFWLKSGQGLNKTTTNQTEIENKAENKIEEIEKTSEKIPVPDFAGRNFEKLKKELENRKEYSLLLLGNEFSDTVGEGNIISQTPTPGQEMFVSSTIAVNVSKGPQKRQLPNIEGKTISEASSTLTERNFIPIQAKSPSNKYPEQIVIGYKDYKAGDSVDYGTEIVILVSTGI